MAVLVKASLIGFSVLALVGCAGHAHRLLSTKSEGVVIGSFAHEGNTEPSMTVEFEGQQYSSRGFTITRSQNFADLNKQFGGSSGQHYQRMKSGSDNERFVYSANPVLQNSDGKTMQCALAWRSGQTPAGSCKTEHNFFTLLLKNQFKPLRCGSGVGRNLILTNTNAKDIMSTLKANCFC